MSEKRLRIQSITVHVALVFDDGEEIEPGPALNPVTLPLSKARELIANLPAEVAILADQLKAQRGDVEGVSDEREAPGDA